MNCITTSYTLIQNKIMRPEILRIPFRNVSSILLNKMLVVQDN